MAQNTFNDGMNHFEVEQFDGEKNEATQHQSDDASHHRQLRFDAQEYIGMSEDEVVDFDTPEEFLLHFSRIGQVTFVDKLIDLRDRKEIMLNIDCKGESKANFGWSPLHLAAYFGHTDVVESLLKAGADVDVRNEEGDTPLHKAAYTGRDSIVVRLVAANASVFTANGDGRRARELAKSESIREIITAAELTDVKRREARFLSAARNGDLATLKRLLEDSTNAVDINCVDASGNTALHCAAYRGKAEIVEFLLKSPGLDTAIKNNRDQTASAIASTITLKQAIQQAHLACMMSPRMIASLRNRAISRFEGVLLKKGRFFGWKLIWAVLERGVFSFFATRADAASGIRRKGYKYLENAIAERVDKNGPELAVSGPGPAHEPQQHIFAIIFGDRSRALFSLPKSQTELDLQKWLNAINDHIYFGTNFIKQGTRLGDSDDEDEAAKILPMSSVHDMMLTATAHQKILEKHIAALQLLLDDESLFIADDAVMIADNASLKSMGVSSTLSNSTIPSVKFHLNLILESSRNANSSLVQCLTVISHQNEARQTLIRQEQEKVRVLETALQVFAREHHDLERSILSNSIHALNSIASITMPSQQQQSQSQNLPLENSKLGDSLHHQHAHHHNAFSTNSNNMAAAPLCRARSFACQSVSSTADEFFDAFDDEEDMFMIDQVNHNFDHRSHYSPSDNCDNSFTAGASEMLSFSNSTNESAPQRNRQLPAALMNKTCTIEKTTTFHTACDEDLTINDSIATLEDELDDDEENTLELSSSLDDNNFKRDRLPAPMVPRDEVGLWSILKHCIGKELSKITIPVVFNEPLSFLQRMAEIFENCNYLNIADQCDDAVERMENICAFIISAYSSNWLRLNKPFNPLLGETFELEIASSSTHVVLEQVSHHPPISAWHAESPHFILRGSIHPRLRFWGKSIEVKPEGSVTLELKHRRETYTWRSINCCVHNIIVGKLWFEQYGNVEVTNHANRYKIALNFKQAGWFGADLNRFDGFIVNDRKERVRFLYGKWNDYLKSSSIDDYDDYLRTNNQKFRAPDKPTMSNNNNDDDAGLATNSRRVISKITGITRQLTGTAGNSEINSDDNQDGGGNCSLPENGSSETGMPKSDSSHSLDISNSRILWKAPPRPDHSPQYYHFNAFAFTLNELPAEEEMRNARYPITDSRFRPDIRKLEEGDLDGAAAEKHRLEEKQRETRRLQKKRKDKEWDPIWFRKQTSKVTNDEEWHFDADAYGKRDWSRCPDIF